MTWHFAVMILASLFAFCGILFVALRARRERPAVRAIGLVATIVVVGGMLFAKIGATAGWPVWLYYGVPAGLTWLLPPLAFRMAGREIVTYLVLALFFAPVVTHPFLVPSRVERIHAVYPGSVASRTDWRRLVKLTRNQPIGHVASMGAGVVC